MRVCCEHEGGSAGAIFLAFLLRAYKVFGTGVMASSLAV